GGQEFKDVAAAVIGDGMDGIEAKAIEVELRHPVKCTLNNKLTDHLCARSVIVDRFSPRAFMLLGEDGGDGWEIVSMRTEVVIDHVEEHHQRPAMGRIDERF